ncbi:MAG: class I SAM-dependent methyltransferase [Prevotellaceae bacterium]|jgi:predicted O-methyltransferase YrrM|nr:class I SAM-dependent methyltransferase [Prevotellaceae bacterium]
MEKVIDTYCLEHSTPEPELLRALSRETYLRVLHPRMLAHWQQGLLLQQLAKLVKANNILEIGTFTGYSALCLAAALPPHGALHTYDVDDEALEIAQEFICQSLQAGQIKVHHQNALEGAPLLVKTFELVFIDGDKREYPDYYRMAMKLTPPGGLIVADNVLWGEKVLNAPHAGDKHTKALQEFNEMVRSDDSVEKIMLPLRDGLTLIRKK